MEFLKVVRDAFQKQAERLKSRKRRSEVDGLDG